MTNVQFNEEQTVVRAPVPNADPLFVRLVLRTGFAKTRRGAEYVLIGVIIASIALAIIVFPKGRPAPAENIPVAGPLDTRTR